MDLERRVERLEMTTKLENKAQSEKIESLTKQVNDLKKEVRDQRKQVQIANDKCKKAEKLQVVLKSLLLTRTEGSQTDVLNQLKIQVNGIGTKVAGLENKAESNTRKVDSVRKDFSSVEIVNTTLDARLSDIERKAGHFAKGLKDVTPTNDSVMRELSSVEFVNTTLDSRLSDIERKAGHFAKDLNDVTAKMDSMRNDLSSVQNVTTSLQSELCNLYEIGGLFTTDFNDDKEDSVSEDSDENVNTAFDARLSDIERKVGHFAKDLKDVTVKVDSVRKDLRSVPNAKIARHPSVRDTTGMGQPFTQDFNDGKVDPVRKDSSSVGSQGKVGDFAQDSSQVTDKVETFSERRKFFENQALDTNNVRTKPPPGAGSVRGRGAASS